MTKENIIELEMKWAELLKGPKRSNEYKVVNKKITAAELQGQLQQDEEYQRWFKEKDRVRLMLKSAYREDERPLIEDLMKAGLNITSSWDLVNAKSSYKAAIPILVDHLSRPYHIKNKEGIVRALAVKEAMGIACRAIVDEYNKAPKDNFNYRWALGNTIAVIITREYLDDVILIVQDESNGDSRQMFVSALGIWKSQKVKEVLRKLLDDKSEVISEEARKVLKKLK